MKRHQRFLGLVILFVLAGSMARADCRGCCSSHGGIVCVDGVTRCKDGSPLSEKCESKGCDKCGNPTAPSASSTGPAQVESTPSYNRKDWPHWIDEDGDCQDTRAEILIRDNIGTLKFKRNKGCNVSWGEWLCPYTGKTSYKASDLDIDHIVPLAHAHRTGGVLWPREKKRAFANDPENLLVVDDSTNQEKGDQDPTAWKPPQTHYWAEYARRWRAVKLKYGLVISVQEERALQEMLLLEDAGSSLSE